MIETKNTGLVKASVRQKALWKLGDLKRKVFSVGAENISFINKLSINREAEFKKELEAGLQYLFSKGRSFGSDIKQEDYDYLVRFAEKFSVQADEKSKYAVELYQHCVDYQKPIDLITHIQSYLNYFDISGMDLSNLDLRGNYWLGKNLQNINFRNAIFSKAMAEDVNFKGTDFTGADLRRFDFRTCSFKGANLTDTDLSGNDLASSYLHGAIGLGSEGTKLKGTKFSVKGIVEDPKNINPEEEQLLTNILKKGALIDFSGADLSNIDLSEFINRNNVNEHYWSKGCIFSEITFGKNLKAISRRIDDIIANKMSTFKPFERMEFILQDQ